MSTETPRTEAAIVRIKDEEGTRNAGSSVTAVYRRWIEPEFSRQLERELDALRAAADALADAVGNMRNPQTIEDVAMMIHLTIGPALLAYRNLTAKP